MPTPDYFTFKSCFITVENCSLMSCNQMSLKQEKNTSWKIFTNIFKKWLCLIISNCKCQWQCMRTTLHVQTFYVHGTISAWHCTCMSLRVHDTACAWHCMCTSLLVYDSVCAWHCMCMALHVHDTAHTWHCMCTTLYVHDTASRWH
jgi:hypothetical protein